MELNLSTPHGSIVALDGSSWVGVCHGPPGQNPTITTWKLQTGDAGLLGEMLCDLRTRLRDLINASYGFGRVPIKTAIFEKPLLNQKTPNLVMQRKLYSIAGVIEMVCYELEVDCFEIDAGTWKKAFTGTGRVSKKQKPYPPWVRCEELGWKCSTTDEADACGIWTTFVNGLNDPSMQKLLGPLFVNS
jgi:Holliday junction resolvasome RuvABC endonuclease subunit